MADQLPPGPPLDGMNLPMAPNPTPTAPPSADYGDARESSPVHPFPALRRHPGADNGQNRSISISPTISGHGTPKPSGRAAVEPLSGDGSVRQQVYADTSMGTPRSDTGGSGRGGVIFATDGASSPSDELSGYSGSRSPAAATDDLGEVLRNVVAKMTASAGVRTHANREAFSAFFRGLDDDRADTEAVDELFDIVDHEMHGEVGVEDLRALLTAASQEGCELLAAAGAARQRVSRAAAKLSIASKEQQRDPMTRVLLRFFAVEAAWQLLDAVNATDAALPGFGAGAALRERLPVAASGPPPPPVAAVQPKPSAPPQTPATTGPVVRPWSTRPAGESTDIDGAAGQIAQLRRDMEMLSKQMAGVQSTLAALVPPAESTRSLPAEPVLPPEPELPAPSAPPQEDGGGEAGALRRRQVGARPKLGPDGLPEHRPPPGKRLGVQARRRPPKVDSDGAPVYWRRRSLSAERRRSRSRDEAGSSRSLGREDAGSSNAPTAPSAPVPSAPHVFVEKGPPRRGVVLLRALAELARAGSISRKQHDRLKTKVLLGRVPRQLSDVLALFKAVPKAGMQPGEVNKALNRQVLSAIRRHSLGDDE